MIENKDSDSKSAHTNKILAITCGSIFLLILIISGLGLYLTTRESSNTNANQSNKQSNWLTYNNSEGKFSIEYPKNYTKEDDSSGMGADFTSSDSTNTLRAFYILSNGKNANDYLNNIYQLSQKSMPLRTVTEIDKSNQNLGSLSGQMRIWKYDTSNTSKVEIRIAAVGGNNIYNISMTCDYDNYTANIPIIKQMAESFKTK